MKKYILTVVYMLMSLSMMAQTEQSSGAPANVEAVDLGLPSGTRWANMNVGASSPEEYGGYYSWGETEEKDDYSWNNYSYLETYEKYDGYTRIVCKHIGNNISGTQYDVAHIKWGGLWRMPTKSEMEELLEYCVSEVTILHDAKVVKFTGPSGKAIFFPFTGMYFGENGDFENEGYTTMCWSGDLASNPSVWALAYNSDNYNWVGKYSSNAGFSVRPVIKVTPSVPKTFIDLGLPSGTKWANMNIGASRPEEYGKYFAWGETLEKDAYTWDNYMCPELTCGNPGDPVYDLVGDKADIAGTKFDAATMNWGASWNIPTAKQMEELASNCYSSLETIDGVACRKLTSRINNNEIIFPLAGARWFEDFAYEGTVGYYWSSTLRSGGYVSPCRFIVREDNHGWGWSMGGENDRFCAFPIRPVYAENNIAGDTLKLRKFSVILNGDDESEILGSAVTFQRNENSENYSLSSDERQEYDPDFDISKVSYITRKSIGTVSLPEGSVLGENDLTITVDGDTISTDGNGVYDATGSTIIATNNEGEVVYMNIATVEDANNATGADLNAKESAITLMLPLVPNIFVAFDDEQLPHLKEMIWDVDEVKQLAEAIDRSVAKYGYTDFGEISKEAAVARNKISQLLHLDKLAEKQTESMSRARRMSALHASGSVESPYIANPYGYGGLQVEITDCEKKQFYTPYKISGYNCEVTAYNWNRFAYSSLVKGKYDAETNTYYIPDLGDEYEYYKNILKPQKVSTFMNTFTSFKYDDLERLGQFLEESVDLLQGDIGFSEMHWSDEKKTANFNISEQDDAIVLLFPRGNDYMMVYNIMQSIMKPIVKVISKKASKAFDSDVFIPVVCGKLLNDPNYILEVKGMLNDANMNAFEKIDKVTSVTWTKFLKLAENSVWDSLDKGLKDSFTDLIGESVKKVGSIEAAYDYVNMKAAFKVLGWIKKYGDIFTGVLGTFFEDNAVYPVYWEANGQFVLAEDAVTVGEGEDINVRILVGGDSYHAESSDEETATVTGAYNKVKIHGVDAGDAVITVRDKTAMKSATIKVHVTGIQTFVLAESEVSVPMYKDCSVTIERGDGPFHISGGDAKIAVAKLGGGNPLIFPGEKYAVVISGVSEGSTTFYVYNEATDQTLPLVVNVTAEHVVITDDRIVDLGLSVNWANCNVGASEPQEDGYYFAWGEVEPKDYYSLNNYKYYSNGSFVDIGSDISGTEYDAATHNMGNGWRMPTKAEYDELIDKCEWKFVTYRRVRGWKVTGPSGNSIFLPASGYMLNDWNEDVSIDGYYWSSNITDNHREVHTLYATMDNYKMSYRYMNCFDGRTIRAVTGNKGEESGPVQTETFTVNGVSFNMIKVEGGTFQMGTNEEDGYTWAEQPKRQVTLSSYSIGQTEVTNALWGAVMPDPYNSSTDELPVDGHTGGNLNSDYAFQEFIMRLSGLTGRSFRLPTVAEWEYAARGGKYSHGYVYAGSDDIGEVAWYSGNSYDENAVGYLLHPVAQKQPNELNLYDMSGNVTEACLDSYFFDYNSYATTNNPYHTGSSWEEYKMCRGGSTSTREWDCRVLKNDFYSNFGYNAGARLACSEEVEVPIDYHSCPNDNHPHLIDLGLPSGTKWACCNIGGNSPEDFGNYYARGEIEEKELYNWENYSYVLRGIENICGTSYDVATVKWGAEWQTPSKEQILELLDGCFFACVTINGVRGMKFTSQSNGASIFLPASGYRIDSNLYGTNSFGSYLSGTRESHNVRGMFNLFFDLRYPYWCDGVSDFGQSVRPVKPGPIGDSIGGSNYQGGGMKDE